MAVLRSDLRGEMAELRSDPALRDGGARWRPRGRGRPVVGRDREKLRTLFLGLAGLQMSGARLALAVAPLA